MIGKDLRRPRMLMKGTPLLSVASSHSPTPGEICCKGQKFLPFIGFKFFLLTALTCHINCLMLFRIKIPLFVCWSASSKKRNRFCLIRKASTLSLHTSSKNK